MVQKLIEISKSDCQKVLAKYFDNTPVKLIDFSVKPITNEIHGFNGDYLLLKITIENGIKSELQFFAKTIPTRISTAAEFVKTSNMFNKEVYCYQFLEEVKKECPSFDISFAPKYYFSRKDEVIILEDISEIGYKMWNESLDLDLEHIKLSLKATAKFHAASFIFEEIKSEKLGRKYRLIEDYAECLKEGLFRSDEKFLGYQFIQCGVKSLQALVDLLPEVGLTATEFKAKLSTLTSQIFEDIKPSKQFRNVWCHGDLWWKNVMFRYKNTTPFDSKIFDFQLNRYNPPAHDVLFIIHLTTNKKTRQEHFHHLLDYYYACLKQELGKEGFDIQKILTRDEFDKTIPSTYPVIKLTKLIYRSLSLINREHFNEVTNTPEAYAKITYGDRSKFLVDVFRSQKSYRDGMIVLFEDLEDLLAHQTITLEDCYKILKEKLGTADYDLLEYKVVSLDERSGFLGDHRKLKIKVRSGKELSFFVKGVPLEEAQKQFVIDCNMFYKEMKFYTEIVWKLLENNITSIKECVSACYLARLNDVIVFDDYSSKGYRTLSPRLPYDYETVVVVIKKLARFHACGLILEETLSTPENKYRLENYYEKQLQQSFYNDSQQSLNFLRGIVKGIETHIDLFPDENSKISPDLFKKRAAKAFSKMWDLVKPSKKYRNTICHGDLWSNNILLKFKNNLPVDCLFIDLQSYRYSPPAQDVMSLIYLTTDRKLRARHMTEILNLYHSEMDEMFQNHGLNINNVLPYNEFMESCEDLKEFAVTETVSHFHNIMLTSDQINELFSDPELNNKYFFEDRGPFLRKNCERDPVYMGKMLESITDFRELCEGPKMLD